MSRVADTTAPCDEATKQLLFDKMKQDYPKSGVYAVGMLETAECLLEQSEQHPRQAEAAAYCIRQAAVELFGGSRGDKKLLSSVAAKVVRVADTLDVTGTPSEDGPTKAAQRRGRAKRFRRQEKKTRPILQRQSSE